MTPVRIPPEGITTCPHYWPLGVHGSPSFLSLLGLQDKLNKRDKEVTALTSQMDMLRAQVSGKSPSLGEEVGGLRRLAQSQLSPCP